MNVVMMSPEGTLGDIPAEQVEAAKLAGFRVMTSDDLKAMYQRLFMEHSLIQHKEKLALKKFAPRQSMRKRMRGKR